MKNIKLNSNMQINKFDLHNRTLKSEQQGIHEPHRSHVWLFILFLVWLGYLRKPPTSVGVLRRQPSVWLNETTFFSTFLQIKTLAFIMGKARLSTLQTFCGVWRINNKPNVSIIFQWRLILFGKPRHIFIKSRLQDCLVFSYTWNFVIQSPLYSLKEIK